MSQESHNLVLYNLLIEEKNIVICLAWSFPRLTPIYSKKKKYDQKSYKLDLYNLQLFELDSMCVRVGGGNQKSFWTVFILAPKVPKVL